MTLSVQKKKQLTNRVITIFICFAAVMFILPTVLTIANSFMTSGEISANYGALFGNMTEKKKEFMTKPAS